MSVVKNAAVFISNKFGLGDKDANVAQILLKLATQFMSGGKDKFIKEFEPLTIIISKYIKND